MKAFCTLTVRTLSKRPIRSRQMKFNMPKGTFGWCVYKRTSFRTVSESYLHTLDSIWNVVKSVSVWFPQSRPAPVLMCEDTSEDIWVPSVRHVACNQSDSRLVWSLCHWPKRLKQSWVFKNFIRPHQCPAIIYQRQSLQSLITHKFHSSLFSKGLSSPSVKVNLWFINQHRLNTVQTCNEIMCGISVLIWAVLQPLLQFKLH